MQYRKLFAAAGLAALAALLGTAWAQADITALPTMAEQRAKPIILPADPRPALHGPRIVGASPGRPFLFRIPATGQEPLTFSAAPLPAGLSLEARTGILSGKMTELGAHTVHVRVNNAVGTATRTITFVCGEHRIALTPPMGWNAWNIYANTVTGADIRAAADALVKTGLAAHGYQYVSIDDSWEGGRDKDGHILPNRRIGDIGELADYVHAQGLKLGLYSAPTEQTCSGFAGSRGHEAQDARTYAQWGVDLLKYDWCPNRVDHVDQRAPQDDAMKAAYGLMGAALQKTDRDIVFAVSTYGRGSPWDWTTDVGGSSWSSSPALFDDWTWLRGKGLSHPWSAGSAKPGHWDDPGLLLIGRLGYGAPHRSRLSPSEQMLQFSLWSLLSAPLTLSCDLRRLDPNAFFPETSALLTNDEVIDVDQDPLGRPATQISNVSGLQVWAKPLSDGTTAVGLLNLSDGAQTMTADWDALHLSGPQPVRDLWLHRDFGPLAGGFSTPVPAHGVALFKVGNPQPEKAPG